MQVEPALRTDLCGVALGPGEVLLALDDDLQFVSPGEGLLKGRLLPLGREAHPVEHPAEGVRAGGFEEDFEPLFAQRPGQHAQRVEQRLAARDDDGLCGAGRGACDNGGDVGRRVELRVPRVFGVAPAAADVAAAQADEVGRFPGVEPFALDGVEILDEGQAAPPVEQFGMCFGDHVIP